MEKKKGHNISIMIWPFKKLFVVPLVIFAMCIASIWQPSDHAKRIALVDQLAKDGVKRGYWPGIVWAEVAPGRIISAGAAGYSDIQAQRLMTIKTKMPIGSISKVLVGLSGAQAIYDGKLGLTTPLSEFLTVPFDAPDGLPRTFEHLSSHSAGILDTEEAYALAGYHTGSHRHPLSLPKYLASVLGIGGQLYDASANFGDWIPGARYEYSNVGAGLAAQAISDATERSFESHSIGKVIEPLGIDGFWGHEQKHAKGDATLYSLAGDGEFDPLEPYGLATWPDGQFNASVSDLAKLLGSGPIN